MENIITRSVSEEIPARSVSDEDAAGAPPATASLTLRVTINRKNTSNTRHHPPMRVRRGVATLDYVLVMAVVLPLAAFLMWSGPRMMNLVYEMTAVLISWPFL